ncbi:radical SAM family heme chaperone HemW [Petrocella sp. FN5]|uniref:radical SAM family heme chaperone HemW n=1 Tax=Petrocella sp. FN5 TaxID=3032002 RepID=UPI0023DBB5C7|nr:radical SAM family heme chaperone HemW [Petrocella sp. FN5]MDF1618456.1 radical SAM family heme chaperone HemW [Petrocella sp. FN5]
MKKMGLYVHIPFCVKKCDYCDFLSFDHTEFFLRDAYVDALVAEILAMKSQNISKKLSTIYIGGGTPSILSAEQFSRIMKAVYGVFEWSEDGEFTIEVNPGMVDALKVKAYLDAGVNRVSMGLQSDEAKILKTLGRIHDYQVFLESYEMIRAMGIDNISIDLMFGLPGQTFNSFKATLEKIIELEPEHLSLYGLIIEPGTVFESQNEKGLLDLPSEDEERQMYWWAHDTLLDWGYEHYEISSYGKVGRTGRHNRSYWTLDPYLGVGLGAASYLNHNRYKNIEDLNSYIEKSHQIKDIRELEQTGNTINRLEEWFFLGLRQLKGLNLIELKHEFGESQLIPYQGIIKQLIKEEMLVEEDGWVRFTRRGLDLSNYVLAQFINF